MISVISTKYKILQKISISYFILMVHNLLWKEVPTKMFFHNQTMLKNIPLLRTFPSVRIRMIWHEYIYIAISALVSAFEIPRSLPFYKFSL